MYRPERLRLGVEGGAGDGSGKSVKRCYRRRVPAGTDNDVSASSRSLSRQLRPSPGQREEDMHGCAWHVCEVMGKQARGRLRNGDVIKRQRPPSRQDIAYLALVV